MNVSDPGWLDSAIGERDANIIRHDYRVFAENLFHIWREVQGWEMVIDSASGDDTPIRNRFYRLQESGKRLGEMLFPEE